MQLHLSEGEKKNKRMCAQSNVRTWLHTRVLLIIVLSIRGARLHTPAMAKGTCLIKRALLSVYLQPVSVA